MPKATVHKEVLTAAQVRLIPLVKDFSRDFYLAGGTAIALHIGHRESVDFVLFSSREFDSRSLRGKSIKYGKIENVFINKKDEFTVGIAGIKITFLHYPFSVKTDYRFDHSIRMPSLLDLASMKAYALGRRAKWKDYVDLYFVIKQYHSLKQIARRARKIFGTEFNEKIFRVQLSYFRDIDYSEKIIYLPGQEVADRTIQRELTRFSLD